MHHILRLLHESVVTGRPAHNLEHSRNIESEAILTPTLTHQVRFALGIPAVWKKIWRQLHNWAVTADHQSKGSAVKKTAVHSATKQSQKGKSCRTKKKKKKKGTGFKVEAEKLKSKYGAMRDHSFQIDDVCVLKNLIWEC